MELEHIVNLCKAYLKSIGSGEEFVNKQIDINKFSDGLALNLPDVCVVQPNRLKGGRSNQTHIHCTGQDMSIFYDSERLSNTMNSTEDEEISVTLISSNLQHLEIIKEARRQVENEFCFYDTNKSTTIETSTVKKISKRKNQAPQVQISKKRLDGSDFTNLRSNLFTNDRLVFLKYEDESSKYLVIGIPSTFNNVSYSHKNNVMDYIMDENNQTYDISSQRDTLREVDIDNIATYAPNDEDDNNDYNFNLYDGIKKRKKRTERHSSIVKLFAQVLVSKGFLLYEGRIDCLGVIKNHKAIVCEIKTLDGSKSDENKQVMKAFSQVFYYEKFNMGEFASLPTQKVVVFENKVSDEHILFFEQNDILVYWIENNMIHGTEYSLSYLYGLDII